MSNYSGSLENVGYLGSDLLYTFDSEGTLTILGTGRIEQDHFTNWRMFGTAKNVKKLIIHPGISIGENAFYDFTGLKELYLSPGVTSIGTWAFRGCTSLTSVTIPATVSSIGDYAFWGCSRLETVTILGGVTTIGGYAFWACTNLKEIRIPTSVKKIEPYAFWECPSITDVYYAGTSSQWSSISIEPYNEAIRNANKHYGWIPEESKDIDHDGRISVLDAAIWLKYGRADMAALTLQETVGIRR